MRRLRKSLLLASALAAGTTVLVGCAANGVNSDTNSGSTTAAVKPSRMAAGEGRIIVGHPALPDAYCNRMTVERLGPAPAGVKSRFDISFGLLFGSARITEMDLPAAKYAIVETRCQANKNTITVRSSSSAASLAMFEVRAGEVADIGRLEMYTFRSAERNLGRPMLVVHQAGLETVSGGASFMPASASNAVKRPLVPSVVLPPDVDAEACRVERREQAKGIVLIPKEPYPCEIAKRKGLNVGSS